MHIINLTPLEPGVYNDHCSDTISTPPDGWAYIPDDFQLPSTFPRLGVLEAEKKTYTRDVEKHSDNGEVITEQIEYTMMTVTKMTEGTLPPVVSVDSEPTQLDRIEAQVAYIALMTDTLMEV